MDAEPARLIIEALKEEKIDLYVTLPEEPTVSLRIPNQIGHPFRRKSATCSEANRPGLRSKSATPLGIG